MRLAVVMGRIIVVLAVAGAWLPGKPARALPILTTVNIAANASQGGFGYSWIHTNPYSGSGTPLFALEGSVPGTFEDNAGALTLAFSGFLTTTPQNVTYQGIDLDSNTWAFEITSASFTKPAASLLADGTLDYILRNTTLGTVFSAGTFTFALADLTGPANSLSLTELFFWGGNGVYSSTGIPLGIDLGGSYTPVPEPSTISMFGIGLAGLGLLGWRTRRRERRPLGTSLIPA